MADVGMDNDDASECSEELGMDYDRIEYPKEVYDLVCGRPSKEQPLAKKQKVDDWMSISQSSQASSQLSQASSTNDVEASRGQKRKQKETANRKKTADGARKSINNRRAKKDVKKVKNEEISDEETEEQECHDHSSQVLSEAPEKKKKHLHVKSAGKSSKPGKTEKKSANKIVKRKMKLRWRNVTMRMKEESEESSETDSEGEEEEESFDDGSESEEESIGRNNRKTRPSLQSRDKKMDRSSLKVRGRKREEKYEDYSEESDEEVETIDSSPEKKKKRRSEDKLTKKDPVRVEKTEEKSRSSNGKGKDNRTKKDTKVIDSMKKYEKSSSNDKWKEGKVKHDSKDARVRKESHSNGDEKESKEKDGRRMKESFETKEGRKSIDSTQVALPKAKHQEKRPETTVSTPSQSSIVHPTRKGILKKTVPPRVNHSEVCDARPITPMINAVMFGSWADDDDESENPPNEMDNGEIDAVLDDSSIEEGEVGDNPASPTLDNIAMNVSMECNEGIVNPEESISEEKKTAETSDVDRGRSRSIPNKKKQGVSPPLHTMNLQVKKRKTSSGPPEGVKVDGNRNEGSSRSTPKEEIRPSSSSSIKSPRNQRSIPDRRSGNSDRPRPRYGESNSSRSTRSLVRDGDQGRNRRQLLSSSFTSSCYSTPRSISIPRGSAKPPPRHDDTRRDRRESPSKSVSNRSRREKFPVRKEETRRERRESPSRSASNRSRKEKSPVRKEDTRDKRRPSSSRNSSPQFSPPRSVSHPSKTTKSSEAEKEVAKMDGESHKSIPKKEIAVPPSSSVKSANQPATPVASKSVQNPVRMIIPSVVKEEEEMIDERRKTHDIFYSFDEEPLSPKKSLITIGGRYCSLSAKVSSIGRLKTYDRSPTGENGRDEVSSLPHPDHSSKIINETLPSSLDPSLSGIRKGAEPDNSSTLSASLSAEKPHENKSIGALFSQEKPMEGQFVGYDLSYLMNRPYSSSGEDKKKEEVKSIEIPTVESTLPLKDPRLKRRSSPIRPSYDEWRQSNAASPSAAIADTQPKRIDKMRRRSDGPPAVRRPSPVCQHSFMQAPEIVCLDVPEAKAKPLTDPLSLCFALKFNTNYEDIINCYERLRSSVTVCRCPSIGKDGIAMLRFIDPIEAAIMLERGEKGLTFEHGRIKLHRPALITFNITTHDIDSEKLEDEIDREIGAIADYFYDPKQREGWICFVEETHASNLLKMGKFVCKSQEGKVYINGFDEIREQGKELRLREDEKWPAHRRKMKAARLREIELRSKNGETDWKSPAMQQFIRDQMDDEGNVTLIGAPIFFEDYDEDTFDNLFLYFRKKGGYANPIARPSSIEDDPGSIAIKFPVQKIGQPFMTNHLIMFLTKVYPFKNRAGKIYDIYIGFPSSIDIKITPPLDINHQRVIVREFQQAFGAVSGFRLLNPEKIEGPSKYRLTFMHMESASRAELVLPVFLHEPFLRGNKKYILSDVTAVKNCQG